MVNLLMASGLLLLFLGLPVSIAITIVFKIKKKKLMIPAICIPVSFVLSMVFLVIASSLYSQTDEYKEAMERKRIEKEQKEDEKRLEEEKIKEEQEHIEAEKEEETKRREQEQLKTEKKPIEVVETEPTEEQTIRENNMQEIIHIENSIDLYYMDLYDNYEEYMDKYVTVFAPLSYVNGDKINIKGEIEGTTGMITITLLEERSDLKEGDFVTVTGYIYNKAMGYLYMKDAEVSEIGENPEQIYIQQKEEYDTLIAQRKEKDIENYKTQCETIGYEDILRNPDNYNGKYCIVKGKVDQIIEGWFDSFTIYVTDYEGNKWGCVYSYNIGESHLLEGDSVIMYGECKGTENARTLLGKQVTIPRVDVEYMD